MDDFQKATIEELKARFKNLEDRNDRLNELLELDKAQLAQCQERLSQLVEDHIELGQLHTKNTVRLEEAIKLFQRVWVMLEECDSLTPPEYNFEADELHELIQDFIGKTT